MRFPKTHPHTAPTRPTLIPTRRKSKSKPTAAATSKTPRASSTTPAKTRRPYRAQGVLGTLAQPKAGLRRPRLVLRRGQASQPDERRPDRHVRGGGRRGQRRYPASSAIFHCEPPRALSLDPAYRRQGKSKRATEPTLLARLTARASSCVARSAAARTARTSQGRR